ncbi:MAG TPA: glycosyltransferase [Syntrophorhabdaceae bacterium]|nr:glycosyltransferase [Syntrophorhabdaceae bacterium]
MKTKILLGPGLYDPKGNEAFLVKAIKEVAETILFDGSFSSFEQLMGRLPKGWEPDFIIIRDAEFYKMPVNLENSPYPVIGLIGDYNLTLNKMLPILDSFDYFFCDTKGVRIFNKLGFNNCEFFCLYGYDPDLHRPYYNSNEKEIDVIFVGNLNRAIQQEREQYLYRLARLGKHIKVKITTGIFGGEFAKLLSSARIVFNRSIRDEANMRFFEAAGCGSTVMSNHIQELDLLGFIPDRDYLTYTDNNFEETIISFFNGDVREKEEEFLSNMKGKIHLHTYRSRAEELINRLKMLHIDISQRRMLRLPIKDRMRRWQRYISDTVTIKGGINLNIFHPQIVAWAKHLIDNELEIKSFDINMWFWWMDLLKDAGLDEYLKYFIEDRLSLIESAPAFDNVKDEFRHYLT